jgi:hypothetical protein
MIDSQYMGYADVEFEGSSILQLCELYQFRTDEGDV